MIAEDQDRTVTRLRHELGAVDVRAHVDQVDRMLRRVHTRRREQRQHRIQMVAALAVVLIAVAGAFVVSWRQPDEGSQSTPAAAVLDWDLRGELAGDKDLLRRAEDIWRESPNPPTGQVRAIYAGRRTERLSSVVVVVLVAPLDQGSSRLAFVTGPVKRDAVPDGTELAVRAVGTVARGQRAIGFLNSTLDKRDDKRVIGGIGFVLGAPGVTQVGYRSSMYDVQLIEPPVPSKDGVVWIDPQPGVAAWNSAIEVATARTPVLVPFVAAVNEPEVAPVSLTSAAGKVRATGDVVPGDLIVTVDGVIGVVVGPDGLVDPALLKLNGLGEVRLEHPNRAGKLIERKGGVAFEPPSGTMPHPGNRVVFAGKDFVVNVGKLAEDGLQVKRMADPATAVVAMRVRTR